MSAGVVVATIVDSFSYGEADNSSIIVNRIHRSAELLAERTVHTSLPHVWATSFVRLLTRIEKYQKWAWGSMAGEVESAG